MIVNNTDNNYYFCRRNDKGEFIENDKIIIKNINKNDNNIIEIEFLDHKDNLTIHTNIPYKLFKKNNIYYLINKNNELCYYNEKENKIEIQNNKFWHKYEQSYFKDYYYNITEQNTYDNKGRADVLIEGLQIEFQHSDITKDKINNRTNIYIRNNGFKKLFWLLDFNNNNNKDNDIKFKKENNKIFLKTSIIKNYKCLSEYNNVYLLIEHNDILYFIYKSYLDNINDNDEYLEINEFKTCLLIYMFKYVLKNKNIDLKIFNDNINEQIDIINNNSLN